MNNDTLFTVKNRSASFVTYNLPERNLRREYAPGEEKTIKFDELEALSYQPGGRELMANFLQITAEEATQALGIKREPEYDLTEVQIRDLILRGSLDEFLDCLDFAPVGVIDLIKQMAVSLPMSDMNKLDALKKKTGFDAAVAIANARKALEDEDTTSITNAPERRVKKETKTEGRRATPKYNVVSK